MDLDKIKLDDNLEPIPPRRTASTGKFSPAMTVEKIDRLGDLIEGGFTRRDILQKDFGLSDEEMEFITRVGMVKKTPEGLWKVDYTAFKSIYQQARGGKLPRTLGE